MAVDTSRADVAILGGGYTGLWTALRIRELEPSARVVILEEDLCGSGPSGRNGGFVTGWWDELPGLIRQFGESEAIRNAMRDQFEKVKTTRPAMPLDATNLDWQQYCRDLASVAVDYHVTQVVDGTKGIHGMIPKSIFTAAR